MSSPFSSTFAFKDSVGINTHLNYSDTAYGNVDQVLALLNTLGISHIRDGLHGGPSANDATIEALYSPITRLAKQGYDFLMVHSPADNLEPMSGAMFDLYNFRCAQSIWAIEGWNEANNGSPVGWPLSDQQWQATLYPSVKAMAQPRLVVAPSLAFQSAVQFVSDANSLGTVPCDFGNLHAYPGANPPTVSIPAQISQIAPVSGSRPILVTETGYNNSSSYPNWVSELAAAKYLPRLLLWNLMNGIQRTYLYELCDWKPDPSNSNSIWHWGLVRADGTVKPAFNSIRNLLSLCADPPAAPQSFIDPGWTIPPNVQHLVLQRGFNSQLWLFWQEIPVWAGRDLSNPPVSTTLTFQGQRKFTSYLPLLQSEPISIQRGSTLMLSIPDHVLAVVVES